MIISFHTEELQDLCCRVAVAETTFGELLANSLIRAIADAEASENALEFSIVAGSDCQMKESSIFLTLAPGFAAIFVPVGVRYETDGDGAVLWETVQRLKLLEILRPN